MLADDLVRFSKQWDQIEARLGKIQRDEAHAREQLERAGQLLDQFEQLTAAVEPALAER